MAGDEFEARRDMTRSRSPKKAPRIDIGAPGIPGGPAIDVTSIPPEYWRAFGLLAFTMNRFIVDHVIRAARLFDNDTESLIIFGMLAHLNIVHLLPPGSRPRTTLDSRGRVPNPQSKLRPVRLRDLAQITGRPRETIRRKLEQLRKRGRVLRLPDGWVYDVSSIDKDMLALTMDSVSRFIQTADIMRSVAKDSAAIIDAASDATPSSPSVARK
jgi:hypothetical protein